MTESEEPDFSPSKGNTSSVSNVSSDPGFHAEAGDRLSSIGDTPQVHKTGHASLSGSPGLLHDMARITVRLVWVLTVIVVVLLVVTLVGLRYGGIPLAMQQFNQWYEQQGVDYHATLDAWDLSVMDGRLSLTGLSLSHPLAEHGMGDRSGIDQLLVDIDAKGLAWSVWDSWWHDGQVTLDIEDVTIEGLLLKGTSHLVADRSGEVFAAGLSIPVASPLESPDQDTTESKHETDVRVRLSSLALNRWALSWAHSGRVPDSEEEQTANVGLSLTTLMVQNVDTATGGPIALNLDLSLDSLTVMAPEALGDRFDRPLTVSLLEPFLVTWDGSLNDWQSDNPGVQGRFAFRDVGLRLLDDVVIQLQALTLDSVTASAEQQSLSGLTLEQLSFALDSSPDNRVSLAGYQLSDAMFTTVDGPVPQLSIGTQLVEGLVASAKLDKSGVPDGVEWLKPLMVSESVTASNTEQSNTEQNVKTVQDASLTSVEASQPLDADSVGGRLPLLVRSSPVDIKHMDLSLTQPGVDTRITSKHIHLGGLDTEQVRSIDSVGDITIERLALAWPDQPGASLLKPLTARWQYRFHDWLRNPRVTGTLGLEALAVGVQGQPELYLKTLTVTDMDVTVLNQSVGLVRLDDLRVRHPVVNASPAAPDLLALTRLEVPDITFGNDVLSIGDVRFSGAEMTVTKRAGGQLAGFPDSQPDNHTDSSAVDAGSSASEGSASPGIAVVVHSAGQSVEGPRSILHWTDHSVSPAYKADITLHQFDVGAIRTGQFDVAESGLTTPLIPVEATVGLDDFNRITLTGQAGLADGAPSGQYTLSIDQLDLVPLSPYVVAAMGYKVHKGMMSMNTNLAITNGIMDGKAKLNLQNSQFTPENEAVIASVSKQIAMPVETVLSVLKDDQNNIKLEIPLSGPLNDPNVGIQDVLSKVSRTAVRTATLFYLKQSFQPYGALISLGSMVSEQLFAIRLDPVTYQPFEYHLTDEQTAYLSTVAKTMSHKPDLELQVCPFYTLEESQPLEVAELASKKPAEPEPSSASSPRGVSSSLKQGAETEVPPARLTGDTLARARATQIKQALGAYSDEKGRALGERITLCGGKQGKKSVVEMGF